ncbi:hypothetical protein, partial [Bacillus gaemokensis]|uniref:hypothetical protein n=1 Tax=Bacillus gaemokensis TaxID=574375 RepID=UPI00053547B9
AGPTTTPVTPAAPIHNEVPGQNVVVTPVVAATKETKTTPIENNVPTEQIPTKNIDSSEIKERQEKVIKNEKYVSNPLKDFITNPEEQIQEIVQDWIESTEAVKEKETNTSSNENEAQNNHTDIENVSNTERTEEREEQEEQVRPGQRQQVYNNPARGSRHLASMDEDEDIENVT